MEAKAVAKWLRVGPRKVRKLLPLVKNKTLDEALAALMVQNSPAKEQLLKCIESAAANAENNHGMVRDELWVKSAVADMGFSMPRMKPRARGRADQMRKPTCHITIVVSDEPREE
ncbi:MAG: 50S ribosomal protein L22 [Armatimonadota bacterium]